MCGSFFSTAPLLIIIMQSLIFSLFNTFCLPAKTPPSTSTFNSLRVPGSCSLRYFCFPPLFPKTPGIPLHLETIKTLDRWSRAYNSFISVSGTSAQKLALVFDIIQATILTKEDNNRVEHQEFHLTNCWFQNHILEEMHIMTKNRGG